MTDEPVKRPARWLRDLELSRAVGELTAFAASWGALPLAPRGDGHGVLVLPGFLTADGATWPLRDVLRRLGHDVRPWDLGRNLGPTSVITRGLVRRLERLHDESGGRVSLVGMSLGGVLARDLARTHPDLVRQVITLGSPFALPPDTTHRNATHAAPLYRAVQPWHERRDAGRRRGSSASLEVPSTAIYTRTDGIVPWTACIQQPGPHSENVEVWGSHVGLAHNPLSLAVMADRLALPEDSWEPFRWDRLARGRRRPSPAPRSAHPNLVTKDIP